MRWCCTQGTESTPGVHHYTDWIRRGGSGFEITLRHTCSPESQTEAMLRAATVSGPSGLRNLSSLRQQSVSSAATQQSNSDGDCSDGHAMTLQGSGHCNATTVPAAHTYSVSKVLHVDTA